MSAFQAGYLKDHPAVKFEGTSKEELITGGTFEELEVGDLWIPEEQRDILTSHPGLGEALNRNYLGTPVVLRVKLTAKTVKLILVDGLQRASTVYAQYGP